jgi:ribosomal protein S18 acetylase RimI-like enzyme
VLLAEAFASDPLMRHGFGIAGAEVPPAPLARLFAPPLAACAALGAVHGNADAAAAWLPAESWPPAPSLAARFGFLALPLGVPLAALWRLARHERACRAALRPAAAGSGYLWLFGVRPEGRGRGVGGALLEAACAAMAARFRRCVLKTENIESLAFYRRRGFTLRDSFVAASGLTVWVLERPLRG